MATPIKQVIDKSTVDKKLPMNYLTVLQGNLKSLSDESYKKLKNSIIKHGFLYPLFVWECEADNLIYILDGTQRYTTLSRMKDEGYSIPQLPVVFIEASDIKDAKEKLAVAASHYGKFTQEGVLEFFGDLEIDSFEFAEIPFLASLQKDEPEEKSDNTTVVTAHERDLSTKEEEKQWLVVVTCKNEADQESVYSEMMERGYECKLID